MAKPIFRIEQIESFDKNEIGLDQVDNTSDANKPISNAQQSALDNKLETTDFKTIGGESIVGSGDIPTNTGGLNLQAFQDIVYESELPNGVYTKFVRAVTQAEYDALSNDDVYGLNGVEYYVAPLAPSGYSISNFNLSVITAPTFNYTGATIDDGLDWSVTDGATTVSGFVRPITAENGVITIDDLTSLLDGNIDLTVSFINGGARGLNVSDSATKNTTVPSGYSVTIDQDPIDENNETAISFTWTAAEVGATYNYSFTSSGGGTPVTGTGTISTATDQITGLDLSGLSNGTIVLTASLINSNGQGADATDTAVKNTTASATQHYENRAGALVTGSDTSVAGWVAGNGISESSTTQARTGTTSLRIASNDGSSQFRYFDFSSGSSGQNDFVGGETATITGYIYAPAGSTPEILLTSSNLNRQAITFTPDTWTQFTFSGVNITASGNLYFYTNSTTGIFIDDMTVTSN